MITDRNHRGFQEEIAAFQAVADFKERFQIVVAVCVLDSVCGERDDCTHIVYLLYVKWFVIGLSVGVAPRKF